jgi:hypothetical protein
MKRLVLPAVLIATAIALTGCSSGSSAPQSSHSAPSAVETPTPTATPWTATEIANNLKSPIPTITQVVTITAANDPNNLLGTASGYSDGAIMYDNRVQCSDGLGVDCGAFVEIWPTAEQAQNRADYIQAIAKKSPILANEWDFVNSNVLLRVDGHIPKDQAAIYQANFKIAG